MKQKMLKIVVLVNVLALAQRKEGLSVLVMKNVALIMQMQVIHQDAVQVMESVKADGALDYYGSL